MENKQFTKEGRKKEKKKGSSKQLENNEKLSIRKFLSINN